MLIFYWSSRQQFMYTFPAPPPDSHTLLNELEEFFSYVEVPQVLEHKQAFEETWTLPTGSRFLSLSR